MSKPRIYIIAPERTADGRNIEKFNRDSYDAISEKLRSLELEPVFPEHDIEGGDEATFESVIIDRSIQLQTCDMALLVPGWQDCPKSRKMHQTAAQNGIFFHPLMSGYDELKAKAYKLFRRTA